MDKGNNLCISKYARVLVNENECIVGNIMTDGRWIRISYEIYNTLVKKISTNVPLLSEYENRILEILKEIGVCIEDNQNEDSLKLCPTDVTIELTTQCNLLCKHCSYSFGGKNYREMSGEMLEFIVEWCEKQKIQRILLTGGEPFCRKDINHIIENIKNRFSGKLEIITNGTLINEECISTILQYVYALHISLDGFDENSVSEIRGKGVYDRVINLIKILHDKKFERITLSCVNTGEDDKIENFKNLAGDLNVKAIIRQLNLKGRAEKNFKQKQIEEFFLKELSEKSLTLKCLCKHEYKSLFFDTYGRIFPCAALREEDLEIGHILLPEQRININGKLMKPIVEEIDSCQNCNVRYFCADTCISQNNLIYPDNTKKSERCWHRKQKLTDMVWNG
ncbi:MAG: radical SAM protein [Lachnospiraceae bacterium]|nr:radical SAM protein [Lachnospiraceae bacterium]